MVEQSIGRVVTGTHNSMSYLPVKQWWLKPFNFVAKCQDRDIYSQCNNYNCIDIRVCLVNNVWHFAHGAITYKGNAVQILQDFLRHISCYRDFYVRIILEKIVENKDVEFDAFNLLCSSLANNYPYITFFGGNYKKTWEQIYDFYTITETNVKQFISSMRDDVRWYEKICPRLYARRMNLTNRKKTIVGINLFDFI